MLKAKALETVTDEDKALELMIEQTLSKPIEQDILHTLDDEHEEIVTKEIPHGTHLKEYVENYKVASTDQELKDQIHYAKEYGCDTIEASPKLLQKYFRRFYADIEKDGYIMHDSVKIHMAGQVDKALKRDARTTYTDERK